MLAKVLIIIASVTVLSLIIGAVMVLRSSASVPAAAKASVTPVAAATASPAPSSPSAGLQSTDEVVGTGDEAVAGKSVSVNYRGTLTNGTEFDSSYKRNQPFDFNLGGGQVIKGWDQGVVGMKVGGKRKLVIPPELGYGTAGAGASIPPNSTLVFEIELLAVK